MTIDHVVFDIGRVLMHYDPELGFLERIPDAAERNFFLEEVCTSDWNIEQDRGRSWSEAEAEAIARHPHRADDIRAFRQNWHRMVPHLHDGSVALLEELMAKGIDVTLLTNFASDTFREAQAMYPVLTRTRGVTVSGDIALIKPDKAIYDRHAADFGLVASRTLFIDDTRKNVDGAIAAGWQAVHFTDPQTLARDLRERGLPVEGPPAD